MQTIIPGPVVASADKGKKRAEKGRSSVDFTANQAEEEEEEKINISSLASLLSHPSSLISALNSKEPFSTEAQEEEKKFAEKFMLR